MRVRTDEKDVRAGDMMGIDPATGKAVLMDANVRAVRERMSRIPVDPFTGAVCPDADDMAAALIVTLVDYRVVKIGPDPPTDAAETV